MKSASKVALRARHGAELQDVLQAGLVLNAAALDAPGLLGDGLEGTGGKLLRLAGPIQGRQRQHRLRNVQG
jgi:hypothetical protein